MVFSSITFIYYFLPIMLLAYYITPNKYKNITLAVGSLLFYVYGAGYFVFLLLALCIFNYILGQKISVFKNKQKRKVALVAGLVVNFGLLFYFKYTSFFIDNINSIFSTNIIISKIILPLGISFFTFQNASYLIDIYRNKIVPSKKLIEFMTYVCTFQHLTSGPIVRYDEMKEDLNDRQHTYALFAHGVERFIIGLSKKVLLADNLSLLIQNLSNLSSTVLSSWIIAICFTLQLYLDFSGYSDMAIGLGEMFGFHLPENFNYPLSANTITDFWRRWHITLSKWFKDYIYIPLGGNRVSKIKNIFNILVVWAITGLWHGAAWNFVIWGLYYAVILIIEKKFFYNFFQKHKVIGIFWTNFLVVIGFVIFNQTNIQSITIFFQNMFGLNNITFTTTEVNYYLVNSVVLLLISAVASTPILKAIAKNVNKKYKNNTIVSIIECVTIIILIIVCTSFIIDKSVNPFLYFKF